MPKNSWRHLTGGQTGHHEERCFLPIHIYDAATGRPVAMILRPGKTPTGKEISGYLRRLMRRIRARWPATRILVRGDSHHGLVEVMAWCEDNAIDYIFGLAGNKVLNCLVDASADDIRFVVTNLAKGSAEHIYDVVYCARGQAENLIKMHKSQLASDRTSCRRAVANHMRLVLHIAAYWLMLTLREAVPATHNLGKAEFATLRLRLLELGARVTETVSRIRLAFAAACPEASLFRSIAATLQPAGP